MADDYGAIQAQADLHHQYFLGLQLMVATREGPDVVGDWMFRLFRSQHEAKFLSSFDKLGLARLPDAVACARYHVLSNAMGGVAVEYMEESDRKAWVRFRYPRWMFDGPTLCGMPVEASRGFLKGWYAHNGVSLGNSRLGFVCVSEDMTGQFGLCGYFQEYDHDLNDDERLRFAPDEAPPPYDPAMQPAPPAEQWSEERLAKANRNYAIEYIRNGLRELAAVIGRDRMRERAILAARLTGLQNRRAIADAVGVEDGGPSEAAQLLAAMFKGMGDGASAAFESDGSRATVRHTGLRVARGLEGDERQDLVDCWTALWCGVVDSHRTRMGVDIALEDDDLVWTINEV